MEVGDSTTAATFSIGGTAYNPVSASTAGVKVGGHAGTAITGAGTVSASALGLTTVTRATVSFAGTAAGWAGTVTGAPAFVKGFVSGGAVVVQCYDYVFAAAANAGTVAITAIGT